MRTIEEIYTYVTNNHYIFNLNVLKQLKDLLMIVMLVTSNMQERLN